jgi:hypothetical protein
MKVDKFLLGIFLLIIIAVSAVAVVGSKNPEVPDTKTTVEQSAPGSVAVENTLHEWGEVPIKGGVVTASFPIKNTGENTLLLTNIATSCMCTTAKLVLGDSVSPEFGMHTKSDYALEVPPGESANLEVVFDPAFHGPSGVGPITRQVKVTTNDPSQSTLNFTLTATVRS